MAEEQPGDRPASAEVETPGEEDAPEEGSVQAEGNGDGGAEESFPIGRERLARRLETDFQALLTGMLIGAAMKASEAFIHGLVVDVTKNEDGIYNPWFTITNVEGETVVVTVTALSPKGTLSSSLP